MRWNFLGQFLRDLHLLPLHLERCLRTQSRRETTRRRTNRSGQWHLLTFQLTPAPTFSHLSKLSWMFQPKFPLQMTASQPMAPAEEPPSRAQSLTELREITDDCFCFRPLSFGMVCNAKINNGVCQNNFIGWTEINIDLRKA